MPIKLIDTHEDAVNIHLPRFFTWLDMEGGREKLESLQKR